jgi:hypothetical protein
MDCYIIKRKTKQTTNPELLVMANTHIRHGTKEITIQEFRRLLKEAVDIYYEQLCDGSTDIKYGMEFADNVIGPDFIIVLNEASTPIKDGDYYS